MKAGDEGRLATGDTVAGTEKAKYLMPGDKIDRYGSSQGKYFSPTSVEASITALAFGKFGGGVQYRAPVTAEVLLKRGIIKKIER